MQQDCTLYCTNETIPFVFDLATRMFMFRLSLSHKLQIPINKRGMIDILCKMIVSKKSMFMLICSIVWLLTWSGTSLLCMRRERDIWREKELEAFTNAPNGYSNLFTYLMNLTIHFREIDWLPTKWKCLSMSFVMVKCFRWFVACQMLRPTITNQSAIFII